MNLWKYASVLDYPRPGLDPKVWTNGGKLKDKHKKKILDNLYSYLEEVGFEDTSWITKIKIVGSLTGYLYNKGSDLDIHMEVDLDKLEEMGICTGEEDCQEVLNEHRSTLNEKDLYLEDTQHPIEYYFEAAYQPSPEIMGIYDVLKEKWIQKPKTIDVDFDLEEIHPEVVNLAEEVMQELDVEIGQAYRKIFTIDKLMEAVKAWPEEDKKVFLRKLDQKFEELEKELTDIVEIGDRIVDKRKEDYAPFSMNNIKFKFLQKFEYLILRKELQEILEDNKVTEDEIPKLKKLLSSREKAGGLYRWDELPLPSQVGEGQGDSAFDFHDFPSNTSDFPEQPGPYKVRMDQLYNLSPSEIRKTIKKQKEKSQEDLQEDSEIDTGSTYYQYTPALPRADQTTFMAYNTIREGAFDYDNTQNLLTGSIYWDQGDFPPEISDFYVMYILGSWLYEKFMGLRPLTVEDFITLDRDRRVAHYRIEDAFTTALKVTAKKDTKIKSILEDLFKKFTKEFDTLDVPKAKQEIIDKVSKSKIKEKDKRQIINRVNQAKTKLALMEYLKNAMLKYRGLGVINYLDRRGRYLDSGIDVINVEPISDCPISLVGSFGTVIDLDEDAANVLFNLGIYGKVEQSVPLNQLCNIEPGIHLNNFFTLKAEEKPLLKRDKLYNEDDTKDNKPLSKKDADLNVKRPWKELVPKAQILFQHLQKIRRNLQSRFGEDYDYTQHPAYKEVYTRWKGLKDQVEEIQRDWPKRIDTEDIPPQPTTYYSDSDLYLAPETEEAFKHEKGEPSTSELDTFFSSIIGQQPYKYFSHRELETEAKKNPKVSETFFKDKPKGMTSQYSWAGDPKGLYAIWKIATHRGSVLKEATTKGVIMKFRDLVKEDEFAFLKDPSKIYTIVKHDPFKNESYIREVAAIPKPGSKDRYRGVSLNTYGDLRVIRITEPPEV